MVPSTVSFMKHIRSEIGDMVVKPAFSCLYLELRILPSVPISSAFFWCWSLRYRVASSFAMVYFIDAALRVSLGLAVADNQVLSSHDYASAAK